jgi:hypothetical protein
MEDYKLEGVTQRRVCHGVARADIRKIQRGET